MATDFVQTTAKGGRSGKNHAAYIGAEGRYANKNEVVFFEDGNLHKLTPTAKDFFAAADKHEAQARSGKGRSYRSLMIPLAHELGTKEKAIEFSRGIAAEVCGTNHAYRLGVHLKAGNWHCHLMFSERKTRNELSLKDQFARGKNNKVRNFATESWLQEVKDRNLAKILKLCPDFKPVNRGEEKIGPNLKNAGASYEERRAERESRVLRLRSDEKALASINRQIERSSVSTVEQRKITSALDRIKTRPPVSPVLPPMPRTPFSSKFQAGVERSKARAEKTPAKSATSALDRALMKSQQKIAAQIKATEAAITESVIDNTLESKARLDAEFRRRMKM